MSLREHTRYVPDPYYNPIDTYRSATATTEFPMPTVFGPLETTHVSKSRLHTSFDKRALTNNATASHVDVSSIVRNVSRGDS